MTPTSLLGGLLTGLGDGLLVALVVFAAVLVTSRRRRPAEVVRPAAEDKRTPTRIGELPKAFRSQE